MTRRFWPHRAIPLTRTVLIRDRRGVVPFRYAIGATDAYVFTLDIYAHERHFHPDRHLGWWRFELPAGRGEARLACDFESIGPETIVLEHDGRRVPALDGWQNPAYALDPLADFMLVLRNRDHEVQRVERGLMKFVDQDVLTAYYARHYAAGSYTPPAAEPFLWELHRYKLARLERLFLRHFPPGSRVADVGCGRSLFTEIERTFPFKVFSGDLDQASVRDRAGEVRHHAWSIFDAGAVPFRDAQFAGLFAGEIIEHVPDVEAALADWRRVLEPGGVAIITTPNRERLVARASGIERPVGVDHVNELSYRQLTRELLPAAGFEVIGQDCLYVELFLRHVFGPHLAEDHLQRGGGNQPSNVWLMRRLFPLGRWFPSVSLDLIVVARRRA